MYENAARRDWGGKEDKARLEMRRRCVSSPRLVFYLSCFISTNEYLFAYRLCTIMRQEGIGEERETRLDSNILAT